MNDKLTYTDTELKVLKNFMTINPNIVIEPHRLAVINDPKKSVVGIYNFKNIPGQEDDDGESVEYGHEPYNHEPYGIFNLPEFIGLFASSDYELKINENFVSVFDKKTGMEIKYNLTPLDMLPEVKDLSKKFSELEIHLDFVLSAEKLSHFRKIASVLKTERIFFESSGNNVKLTGTERSIENSTNPIEFMISGEDVNVSNLGDDVVYLNVEEFKIIEGDYRVKISSVGISHWHNKFDNVEYYIGVNKYEND